MEQNNRISLLAEDEGYRLDSYVSKRLEGYSRSYIQQLINDGYVTVNDRNEKSKYRIKINDSIEVIIPGAEELNIEPQQIRLDILFEDQHIIVINKPRGMVVHPAAGNYAGTLVNALMYHCKGSLSDINGVMRPGIVHRIDKDTTGVLVVAKSNAAHRALSDMLKEHDIVRVYTAIVTGVLREESGKIDAPIGRHTVDRKKMAVNVRNGKKAITHFKVFERFIDNTLVELRLETGRTHQIRVHMSYIGHPVLGDVLYGKKSVNQLFGLSGQLLHARLLGFHHPLSNEYLEFKADIPDDFKNVLNKLREPQCYS